MNKLISRDSQALRAQIDEVVKDLHELTIDIGNEALAKTLSDLRNRLHEPFMFVIVGEVKSGKSSFINALLDAGAEIAKVAPQPLTDTIQQIIHGERHEEVVINKYLKKVLLPAEILKEIAIVDTPGTNTIVEHHQEITESFIPASDLIVFVFEAKNPYRQSAWDFFDFIHEEWRRKIIFVLQQKDLLPAEDLEINMEGVRVQARKKGIDEPQVFAVSAKEEQDGLKQESGFTPLRRYINENITGGKAPLLKLHNSVDTTRNIAQRIEAGLELRRRQWEADLAFRAEIKETLEDQQRRSNKQVDTLVENLIAAYDRIVYQKEKELVSGLSFFTLLRKSLASLFSRQASAQKWLDGFAADFERELNAELRAKLSEGVVDVAESIQQMAKLIDAQIRNSQTILRNDNEIFSDIADRRANVVHELQATFRDFINQSENFTDEALFPDAQSLSPNIVSGSGLAVIGIILAVVTNGMVFDITGGVLTTIGLLFAGLTTRGKRRQALNGFRVEVHKGRQRIDREITEKLKTYIHHLKVKIEGNFHTFDEMLRKEETQLEALTTRRAEVLERLDAIGSRLG